MKNNLEKLISFNILLAIFIIIWGAWVRLSGSGAGCGDHWPLCNGEIVPLGPSLKTIIEYVHRLTSGIFGITIFASLYMANKVYPKRHFGRLFAYSSLFFTITEALIGAILVKKGLVVDNDSALRAWVIGFHLINTFVLLSSLIAQLYFSLNPNFEFQKPHSKKIMVSILLGLIFILVGATGAISALGNTLFPETSLIQGVLKDFNTTSHFLIRLRIFHPIFAILLFGLIQWFCHDQGKKIYKALSHTSWIAVLFGAINWILLAPKWGALLHLFIADFLWCLFTYALFDFYFSKNKL